MENNLVLHSKEQSQGIIATVTDLDKVREIERGLTIQKIVSTALPISEIERNVGFGEVARALDLQLTKLVAGLNLKWNLNDSQIKTIVEDLLDKYKHESLEDFILVFKRARQGEFGELYRLDSPVIFGWMEKYLEEKYRVVEDQLMKEKDTLYKKEVTKAPPAGKTKEWLDKWQKAVSDVETKRISDLTEKQIRKEGREKPASQSYIAPDEQLLITQDKIKRVAAERYKGLYSFSGFQHFTIETFTVFAKSKEEAQEIYLEAI